MRESIKAVLSLIVVVCLCVCTLLSLDHGFAKAGPRRVIIGGAVLGIGALVLLLKMHFKKDKVPDFLSQISDLALEHKGVCFAPMIECEDEIAWLKIWYQNRHERPASVHVVIKPSMGFFLTTSKIQSVVLPFDCGAAAFGFVRFPLALPAKYHGTVQRFDIGAKVKYPHGRGKMLRYRDGLRVGDARINRLADQALTLLGAFGGVVAISRPASFSLRLPAGVAESVSDDSPIETAELWQLGDPGASLEELGVSDSASQYPA